MIEVLIAFLAFGAGMAVLSGIRAYRYSEKRLRKISGVPTRVSKRDVKKIKRYLDSGRTVSEAMKFARNNCPTYIFLERSHYERLKGKKHGSS